MVDAVEMQKRIVRFRKVLKDAHERGATHEVALLKMELNSDYNLTRFAE